MYYKLLKECFKIKTIYKGWNAGLLYKSDL